MTYLRYSPDVEQPAEDEDETFAKIAQTFAKEGELVRKKEGAAKRTSHAKATGLLTGELVVHAGLAPELAQGLFAEPARYEVLARFAQGPGETLPDSVSTHRGMAVKVLGVAQDHIGESRERATQDFVFETGPSFIHSTPARFLADFRAGVSKAPALPEAVKAGVSKVSLATNSALQAVGTESKLLGFFGHPSRHPLSDDYFSQAPMRWGDFVAKVAFVPTARTLERIGEEAIDASGDPDAFRHAMNAYFTENDAEFSVMVQLRTDAETMPVEDAATDWSQEASPYLVVGTLKFPAQASYGEARRQFFDEQLAFQPAHSIVAHRPLGGIMRARLAVYAELQDLRQRENGAQPLEPMSLAEVPA